MTNFQTYSVPTRARLIASGDAVTIPLVGLVKGGTLTISGQWVGTATFTSDPGTGTFAAQTLVQAVGGSAVSTTTGNGVWLIPSGITNLRVTFTTANSGTLEVSALVDYFNEIDTSDGMEALLKKQFLYMNRLGYKGETYPKAFVQSALALTSGTIYFVGVPLLAGDTVSNITVAINGGGGGSAHTLLKTGIYQYSGASSVWTLRASTADWSGSIVSGNENSKALTTPYTAPVDDVYMFAIVNTAATGISVLRGHSGLSVSSPSSPNGGYFIAGSLTGQTDLIASPTVSASGAASIWMAWT